MTDFRRLAAAFDVLVCELELRIAAMASGLSSRRADLHELQIFLDQPSMVGAVGYSEGLHRTSRAQVEISQLELKLSELRAEHNQAQKRRDKCLARAGQIEAIRKRSEQEVEATDLLLLEGASSLAQTEDD